MTFSGTYTATDILTGVLVLVTIFYAYATFKILAANRGVVELMQQQIEQANRPYITVSIVVRTGTPIMHLKIENTGKSGAENLRLELDKDFYQFGERRADANLRNKVAFRQVIPNFPPSAVLEFALGMSFSIFGDASNASTVPRQFTVTANYSYPGRCVLEKTDFDLDMYLATEIPRNVVYDGLSELTKAIQKLGKSG